MEEVAITKTIIREFFGFIDDYTESDVVVVGSGPSGLVAARCLAAAGLKTLIIEKAGKLGGGMWDGGMMFSKMVVSGPAQKIFDEVGVRYKDAGQGLYVADAVEASSKLIVAALDAGAKVLNGVEAVDVVYREDGIKGVVCNWTPVAHMTQECVDPLAFRSRFVIDATGHPCQLVRIVHEKIGLPGFVGHEGSMWVTEAEKATVENTQEIYPGLVVCGMAANSAFGLPRMGPIFGSMFLSGMKAAHIVLERLGVAQKGKNI